MNVHLFDDCIGFRVLAERSRALRDRFLMFTKSWFRRENLNILPFRMRSQWSISSMIFYGFFNRILNQWSFNSINFIWWESLLIFIWFLFYGVLPARDHIALWIELGHEVTVHIQARRGVIAILRLIHEAFLEHQEAVGCQTGGTIRKTVTVISIAAVNDNFHGRELFKDFLFLGT